MKFLSVALLLPSLACAYVVGPPRSFVHRTPPRTPLQSSASSPINGLKATTGTASSPVDQLSDLLNNLTGERLLQSSSDSWRKAIYDAVGAPPTADEHIVAKALQDAMSRKDNQFAILMKPQDDWTATFPSDIVDFLEDGTCWVECQLRQKDPDELLVTMSIQLTEQDGKYLISSLEWQDFRDAFYPGLSGREWLRAF